MSGHVRDRVFPLLATTVVWWAGARGVTAQTEVAEPPRSQASKAEAGRRPESRRATATIAHVRLGGALPDGVGQGGLLADVAPHVHRMVERLDKAAQDQRVKALVLQIDSPALGRARADEIRAAIGRVRAAGKPVAAWFVGGGPVPFSVALACDTIAMPPAGTLEVTGVRAEMTFFKSMLDRLGVQAEILQVGEFKGAGEPLTRDSMSPQLRRQYEAFIGDLFEQLVEQIATGRRLPAGRVRDLVDTGVFTPEAARAAGLIDAVAYEDEVFDAVAERAGLEGHKVARDYAERKLDDDFSGMAGLVKLAEMLSGQKPAAAGKGKRIAIVHVTGEIREGKGRQDLLGGAAAGAETIIAAIREAAKDEAVAAIVLRIDSPGGSALASDLIWRAVKRAGKPVVASLSDVAASGGYYVAVAAERIVAAPGTLTGSIGVVGGKVAVGAGLEKVGIHTDVVSKGRNAGWLSMHEPFTVAEREAFLGTMQDVYRLFTTKVAAGRRLDMARVATLAEGRVFTGRMAREAGLVDCLGGLDEAIDEARRLAGIAADEPLERMLLPAPRGLFDDLLGATVDAEDPLAREPISTQAIRTAILGRIAEIPPLAALAAEVQALELLAAGRPLFMLPARIKVR